jgi:hypothetical protein
MRKALTESIDGWHIRGCSGVTQLCETEFWSNCQETVKFRRRAKMN